MIPKIIHQTAKEKRLTWEENQLVNHLKKVLKEWEYHLWDDKENEQIVKEHFPQFLDKYKHIKRGVAKADIARYMYMYVYGGFYFDTDYKVLKEIPSSILKKKCILPISRTNFRIGNAILASEPNHAFWLDLLNDIFNDEELFKLEECRVEDVTGPIKVTNFYLKNKEKYNDLYLAEKPVFHPQLKYKGTIPMIKKETLGVHFCWGCWRSKNNLLEALITLSRRKIQAF